MEWRCHRSVHWTGLGNLWTQLTHSGLSGEHNSFKFFCSRSQNDCLNPSTLSQLWTPSVNPLVLLVTAAVLDSNCCCKLDFFFPHLLSPSLHELICCGYEYFWTLPCLFFCWQSNTCLLIGCSFARRDESRSERAVVLSRALEELLVICALHILMTACQGREVFLYFLFPPSLLTN